MPLSPEDELTARVTSVLSGNYELEREIGRGGMGVVYCARDRRLKRSVAVKVLPPELGYRSDIRMRFLREAETAAQLSHPNIVPIYTVEEKDNLVYFVMAFIAGDNLGKRITDVGAMDPSAVRRILTEVSDALAYAHGRNVVHRDIKPDNILLDLDTGRAMVTDFGIARALTDTADSRLTATGMAIGTPAYMSPEQSAGDAQIDGRSDLYSLGVVGYQMLCGDLPFIAPNTPSMLVKHLSETPKPLDQKRSGIPMDLSRAVMMLLEKNPSDRFPNAGSLAAALNSGELPTLTWRAPAAVSAPPPTQSPGTRLDVGLPQRQAPPTRMTSGSRPGAHAPTGDELSRWNSPDVAKFRKKLAPYLAVNAVLVPAGIFMSNGFFIATIWWTVGMAVAYSRLWTAGYNWRDVFRQPKDRLMFDVAAETIDDARALFDETKREKVRARARRRNGGLFSPLPSPPGLPGLPEASGFPQLPGWRGPDTRGDATATFPRYSSAHEAIIQQAGLDRDEIHRQLAALSELERANLPDVAPSADAAFIKIQQLAASVDELDRSMGGESTDRMEREINDLEAQANPLDFNGSEARVRRLAQLKRQRRVLSELRRKRDEATAKLENCRALLKSMRLELLRYRSAGLGAPSSGLTMVTQQMQSVVRDLGYLSDAAAEVRAL